MMKKNHLVIDFKLRVNRRVLTIVAIMATISMMVGTAILASSLAGERARRFEIGNAVCREDVK